jgi:hypothetical protein
MGKTQMPRCLQDDKIIYVSWNWIAGGKENIKEERAWVVKGRRVNE